jgi:hypothetical protein
MQKGSFLLLVSSIHPSITFGHLTMAAAAKKSSYNNNMFFSCDTGRRRHQQRKSMATTNNSIMRWSTISTLVHVILILPLLIGVALGRPVVRNIRSAHGKQQQ